METKAAEQTAVEQALESAAFRSRIEKAAQHLGVTLEAFVATLVDELGADSVELLEHVSFQDLMETVPGAKPVKVRAALDVLKGDGKGKGKADGADAHRDLVRDLRDEARLWRLTDGNPLLCEVGGAEHSAANIRHYRRTGSVPKVCTFAQCGKFLAHAKGEVSFEDGATFLTPDGVNPLTGRNEGQYPLADRALAYRLTRERKLSVDDAWRRLADGSLRTHFSVDAAEIEAENPNYAAVLRREFHGVRTSSPADPFYRDIGPGHVRY